MKPPVLLQRTHEKRTRVAKDQATVQGRMQEASLQREALSKANRAELSALAVRAAVLLDPATASGRANIRERTTAQQRFRAPIERVEGFAAQRFINVAARVGLRQPAGNGDYFSQNITRPVPIVSTEVGTLAVELGTSWHLSKAKHSRQAISEKAFFVNVLNISDKDSDVIEEVGYVRLGRSFRRDDWEAGRTDLSQHAGRFVLGHRPVNEEAYTALIGQGSEAAAQASNVLGRLEQAAAAFAILSECAATNSGVETHTVDADAVMLAINATRPL